MARFSYRNIVYSEGLKSLKLKNIRKMSMALNVLFYDTVKDLFGNDVDIFDIRVISSDLGISCVWNDFIMKITNLPNVESICFIILLNKPKYRETYNINTWDNPKETFELIERHVKKFKMEVKLSNETSLR